MKEINVGRINVYVIKKHIKNMYLRVRKDGEVVVNAPFFIPDSKIEEFVFSKREWLINAVERTKQKQNSINDFENGQERTLLGKKYTLYTDTTRNGGHYYINDGIVICIGENSTCESRKKALANVYREILGQILPEIAEECQRKSGIYANEWRIRDMKTRWGSCNTQNHRIWISLWLVEKPLECIKTVVYHELAHIKVKGHNKEFYRVLEQIYPEYKKGESILKGHSI